MTTMKKVKVAEATNAQLDWLVAKCEGHNVTILTVQEQEAQWFIDVKPDRLAAERLDFAAHIAPTLKPSIRVLGEDRYKRRPTYNEAPMPFSQGLAEFRYSSSWLQMGPIIEREKINLEWWHMPQEWHTYMNERLQYDEHGEFVEGSDFHVSGPTPLIAAARCFIVSKLGETVEVPEELT